MGVKPALHLAAGTGPSLHELEVREEKVKGGLSVAQRKDTQVWSHRTGCPCLFPTASVTKKPTHSRQQD